MTKRKPAAAPAAVSQSAAPAVAAASAPTGVLPTAATIAEGIIDAALKGQDAAAAARTLWGADFPSLKADSAQRMEFAAAVLAAYMARQEKAGAVPVAVRENGVYRLAKDGEAVADGEGLALTLAYCAQYAGAALTKLKNENASLGALVSKVRKTAQDAVAGRWRDLCTAYARLKEAEAAADGEAGTAAGAVDPLPARVAKALEDRIVKPNATANSRGKLSWTPARMAAAVKAFYDALGEPSGA